MIKVLNLYFSATGNTKKVAKRIEETLLQIGYDWAERMRPGLL